MTSEIGRMHTESGAKKFDVLELILLTASYLAISVVAIHNHSRSMYVLQELIDHYMQDSDGLAQRLSVPCPRVNMPQTVGLSYR